MATSKVTHHFRQYSTILYSSFPLPQSQDGDSLLKIPCIRLQFQKLHLREPRHRKYGKDVPVEIDVVKDNQK
jgi:hypothetical protein